MNSPIAILAEEGDDLSGAAKMAEEAASEPTEAPKKEEPKEEKKESAPEPPKSSSSESSSKPSSTKSELPTGDRIFATPIAKKIALERGIPLGKIKGSGPDGRILREDVEKYQPSSAGASSGSGVSASAAQAAFGAAPSAQTPDYVDIPLTNMRRTIGSRLTQAKVEAPHYYLTVDVNMDKVTKLREVFNKSLADKGTKLSVNDFIVKAVAKALEDVPEANSAWLGEVIRQYVFAFSFFTSLVVVGSCWTDVDCDV